MDQMILRLPDVMKVTGLSRSSVYLYISEGTFPKQIKLGPRCAGWVESEILEWVKTRIVMSRKAAEG